MTPPQRRPVIVVVAIVIIVHSSHGEDGYRNQGKSGDVQVGEDREVQRKRLENSIIVVIVIVPSSPNSKIRC